jgi:hypothetical protein
MYHGRQRILTLSGSGADDELFKFVWGPNPMKGGGRLGQLLAIGDDSDPNQLDYVCFSDGALDTRRGPQAPLAARATPPGGVPRVKGGPGNLGQIAKRSDGSLVAKYDFNGRVRAAVIGECEDPNALDDCEDCGPCFLEYRLGGDNSFVPVCVCGPSSSSPSGQPGSGCGGTGCGWGPDPAGPVWHYQLVPGDDDRPGSASPRRSPPASRPTSRLRPGPPPGQKGSFAIANNCRCVLCDSVTVKSGIHTDADESAVEDDVKARLREALLAAIPTYGTPGFCVGQCVYIEHSWQPGPVLVPHLTTKPCVARNSYTRPTWKTKVGRIPLDIIPWVPPGMSLPRYTWWFESTLTKVCECPY